MPQPHRRCSFPSGIVRGGMQDMTFDLLRGPPRKALPQPGLALSTLVGHRSIGTPVGSTVDCSREASIGPVDGPCRFNLPLGIHSARYGLNGI